MLMTRRPWIACVLVAFALGASPVCGALISQFTFENDTLGTTGATVNDDGPSNNDGTLQGDAVIVDNGAPRGRALSLDGNGDYSKHPDSSTLDINGNSLSLTGWVYKTDTNDGTLVGKELGSSKAWGVEANYNHVRFYIWGVGGNGNLDNAPGLSNDSWHHVAATYDGSYMRVYIDGMESKSTGFDKNISVNDDPLGIGYSKISGNANNYLAGLIDDVGIYDSSLSAEEVALVHGLGKFTGVDQADPSIAAVLAAFQAGPGNAAVSGGYPWQYATGASLGNPSTTIGFSGVAGGKPFIILDAQGNGVVQTPEPATILVWSLLAGLGIGVGWRRRKR